MDLVQFACLTPPDFAALPVFSHFLLLGHFLFFHLPQFFLWSLLAALVLQQLAKLDHYLGKLRQHAESDAPD